MRFATPVPPRFVAGRTLPLPVVVLFGQQTEAVPDSDDIWVFVSLVKEESGGPPQDDLLLGQRADSIHPLSRRDSEGDRHFAYASFANLAVSARGRYRFRMTAVDMRRYGMESCTDSSSLLTRSSAINGDRSGHGARVLPAITSEAFEVVDPSRAVAAGTLHCFSLLGCPLTSRLDDQYDATLLRLRELGLMA